MKKTMPIRTIGTHAKHKQQKHCVLFGLHWTEMRYQQHYMKTKSA